MILIDGISCWYFVMNFHLVFLNFSFLTSSWFHSFSVLMLGCCPHQGQQVVAVSVTDTRGLSTAWRGGGLLLENLIDGTDLSKVSRSWPSTWWRIRRVFLLKTWWWVLSTAWKGGGLLLLCPLGTSHETILRNDPQKFLQVSSLTQLAVFLGKNSFSHELCLRHCLSRF